MYRSRWINTKKGGTKGIEDVRTDHKIQASNTLNTKSTNDPQNIPISISVLQVDTIRIECTEVIENKMKSKTNKGHQ